jgi:hypothetical protein
MRLVRTLQREWPEYIACAGHGDISYAVDRADWR